MVESPLALFEMQVERVFVDAPQTVQPNFGKAPECLNTVDVRSSPDELTLAVMHPEMFLVPQVHKPVVASPAVAVDDAAHIHPAPDDGLQTASLHIGHDLRVDLSIAFEEPEHNRLSACTASSFAPDTPRTEVRFIDLHFAGEWRCSLRIF